MKIAYITTKNSLKEIHKYQDILFCLAPYCKDEEYKNYFKSAFKYIILDNGVAENILISNEELVNLAIEIKANEIIIPDIIGDYEKTKKQREEFLEKFYEKLKKNDIKIQSVIQGKTIEEYEKCLNEINGDYRIDVIGIPFRINYAQFNGKTKEENCMHNRLLFLNTFNFFKPVHCLGCNLMKELKHLYYIGKVRSCDSKIIARYSKSLQKIVFDDKEKPEEKLFVNDELNDKQIKCLINNIKFVKEVLK